MIRAAVIAISCLALTGCSAHLAGNRSTSGGTTTTTTTSAVSASASVPGGRVAFTSGSVPAPTAPGGQLSVGRSAGLVLLLGVVFVDAVSSLVSQFNEAPLPAAAALPATLSHTCSCYGYQPPAVAAEAAEAGAAGK